MINYSTLYAKVKKKITLTKSDMVKNIFITLKYNRRPKSFN